MNTTIAQAIRAGSGLLQAAGIQHPAHEAQSLLGAVLKQDHAFLVAHDRDSLSGLQTRQFDAYVKRRVAHEPMQYIVGHQDFYKLDFEVTPDVLIPRPETEGIVEAVLDVSNDIRRPIFADIGTGSGCVVISLLSERRDGRAVATDISLAALEVAERNAKRHQVTDRLTLLEGDLFTGVSAEGEFSVIASNPPYIPKDDWMDLPQEVRDHEPYAALVSGIDGLDTIRRLIAQAPSFLNDNGFLIFEIGFGQDQQVKKLIDPNAWELIEIRPDLQGIPRTVVLQKN